MIYLTDDEALCENEENEHKINCLGIDRKLHMCYPWEDKTMCGIKILNKKLTAVDIVYRLSCYECTY